MEFWGIFTGFIDYLLVKFIKTSYNDLRNIYLGIENGIEIIDLRIINRHEKSRD